MGTTFLAVLFGFGQPLWKLTKDSFTGKRFGAGMRAMMSGFINALKNGALITVFLWSSLFLMHLIYTVPKQIRNEARRVQPPAPKAPPGLSPFWRKEYDMHKQRQKEEADAAAKGWITEDRQKRIEAVLYTYRDKRFVVGCLLIGNIDPQKEVEPIVSAMKAAKWPDVQIIATIGSIGIAGQHQFTERLYVLANDPKDENAKILGKAFSVPIHSAKDDPLSLSFLRGSQTPIIVIRQPSP